MPQRVDTVYLGGGTPSLLAPELLRKLFAALRAEFDLDADAEITVECAPGRLSDQTLEAIAAVGVNRTSLGVQSFIDAEARASGRLHTRAFVESDLLRLRAAGITNLNVDLIAGLAGQTVASWEQSLAVLVDSGVPHASVYMLEVDKDSRLGRELLKGGSRYRAELVPADDAIAGMYERADGSAPQDCCSMRSPILRSPASRRGTTCAIGSEGRTSDLAWMRRRCCEPIPPFPKKRKRGKDWAPRIAYCVQRQPAI